MARKATSIGEEEPEKRTDDQIPRNKENTDEIARLNHMLAAVLNYLSDDEVAEIDIETLLNNTEGLREWWDQYREKNRKQIEVEIKQSLGDLSLEELEKIREQIRSSQ